MKRYTYLLIAIVMLFAGCKDYYNETDLGIGGSDDGTVTLALTLKLQDVSTIHSVSTRSDDPVDQLGEWLGQTWENVTEISGYVFVFGNDPDENTYGDGSPLLQKVPFKTVVQEDGSSTISVELDEQTEPCFVRLLTTMTTPIHDQVEGFVSLKMINEGEATSAELTTFEDYKNISVTLLGYYDMENPETDIPFIFDFENWDGEGLPPIGLTTNLAFPLASPGINMPNGLTTSTVDKLAKAIKMVPAASKVDVTVNDGCSFELYEVTLLNGARKARLRSTVLEDDGVTVIESIPLPMNLGGTVQYKSVPSMDGTTTWFTPIYFFPNDGDNDDTTVTRADDEDLTLSDPASGKNPTYLIINGRAEGFDLDGYYKIPIVYQIATKDENGVSTGSKTTYDIIRNNHYHVLLNKVDKPGYATFEEAVNGPANDVSFNITVDTNNDSRNEVLVSDSGLYSMEISASSVYVRSHLDDKDPIELDMNFWLDGNDEALSSYSDTQYASVTCSEHLTVSVSDNNGPITLDSDGKFEVTSETWKKQLTITFSISEEIGWYDEESITIRYGDIAKEIPFYVEELNMSMYANAENITINDVPLFESGISEIRGDIKYYDESDNDPDAEFLSENGFINEYPFATGEDINKDNFYGRNFDGYIYPNDMSDGVVRLYCSQGAMPFHDAYQGYPETSELYYMIGYEDFEQLAYAVDATYGDSFKDCHFVMLWDVDLQEGDPTHSREYIAIGQGNDFNGNFDGNNFTISGLLMNKSDDESSYDDTKGLFGRIKNACIENLSVEGTIIGCEYLGGVVGISKSSTIRNCKSSVNITGVELIQNYTDSSGEPQSYTSRPNYIGGIVGFNQNSNIESCENSGIISGGGGHDIGGIVGFLKEYEDTKTTIKDCKNSGAVILDSNIACYAYGGLIGSGRGNIDIINCSNIAKVGPIESYTPDLNMFKIGGIIGEYYCSSSDVSRYSLNITNCTNSGDVIGSDIYIGGILGECPHFGIINITDCENSGDVEGEKYTGGMVGGNEIYSSYVVAAQLTISNSKNSGSITNEMGYNGGIIGHFMGAKASITGCDNSGEINGNYRLSGIIGYITKGSLLVDNCNNEGEIVASSSNVGGIVGEVSVKDNIIKVTNCTNGGTITTNGSGYGCGGIIGTTPEPFFSSSEFTATTLIEDCINKGNITSTVSMTGGVVGNVGKDTTINRCGNYGAIEGKQYVAGVAASSDAANAVVSNCFNHGDITSTFDNSYIGGVVASLSSTSTLINCYNQGAVTGRDNSGGIVGVHYKNNIITNCYNSADVTCTIDYMPNTGDPAFYGFISASTDLVSDCYYPSTFVPADPVPAGYRKNENAVVMDESVMKSIDFANTLNAYTNTKGITLSEWKQDDGVNGGYPYFEFDTGI